MSNANFTDRYCLPLPLRLPLLLLRLPLLPHPQIPLPRYFLLPRYFRPPLRLWELIVTDLLLKDRPSTVYIDRADKIR